VNILPKGFPSLLPLSQGPALFCAAPKAHRFWYMTIANRLLAVHIYLS
jgi:hypothetical protein